MLHRMLCTFPWCTSSVLRAPAPHSGIDLSITPDPPHKLVDIHEWATNHSEFSIASTIELIDCERLVYDIAYYLAASNTALFESGEKLSFLQRGRVHTHLKRSIATAITFFDSASSNIFEAPLRYSMTFLKSWVRATNDVSECMSGFLLNEAAEATRRLGTSVEGLCPRWGDSVNDSEVRDDGARVQLVLDTSLQQLPQAVRDLHASMSVLASVGRELSLPPPVDEYPATREIVRASSSALKFGRKTVNVAAGVRVLLGPSPSSASIESILSVRAALPQGLVLRLEALLTRLQSRPGRSPAQPSASSIATCKRGGETLEEGAAGAPQPPAAKRTKQ